MRLRSATLAARASLRSVADHENRRNRTTDRNVEIIEAIAERGIAPEG
jgi:hypothetical protein